jgi:hypothetical protein
MVWLWPVSITGLKEGLAGQYSNCTVEGVGIGMLRIGSWEEVVDISLSIPVRTADLAWG